MVPAVFVLHIYFIVTEQKSERKPYGTLPRTLLDFRSNTVSHYTILQTSDANPPWQILADSPVTMEFAALIRVLITLVGLFALASQAQTIKIAVQRDEAGNTNPEKSSPNSSERDKLHSETAENARSSYTRRRRGWLRHSPRTARRTALLS